jgi:hypothetical protein
MSTARNSTTHIILTFLAPRGTMQPAVICAGTNVLTTASVRRQMRSMAPLAVNYYYPPIWILNNPCNMGPEVVS